MENIILVVVLHFISVCNIVIVTVMSSEVSYCVSAMAMQDYTHDTYVCSVVVVVVVPGLPVFPSYISIHCTDWSVVTQSCTRDCTWLSVLDQISRLQFSPPHLVWLTTNTSS